VTFKVGSLSSFLTNRPKSYPGVIQTDVSGRGLRQTILDYVSMSRMAFASCTVSMLN
jgi:hypothetical protein